MVRSVWCGAVAALLLAGLATHADPAQLAVPRLAAAPGDEKLDTRLRPLTTPVLPAPSTALVPLSLPALRGSKAHIFVHLTSVSPDDVAQLTRAGLRIERVSARHLLVRGRIRKKDLGRLAALDVVRSVEPVRPGHLRAGSVTTEGDAASRAPQARGTGFDGTGITVGVISNGIDRVAFSVASGNLPAGTGVPPGPNCDAGSGDEGTAMLEIVHDLAPGATLHFSRGAGDKLTFIDSLTCLRDAGAQVIVDDVGFLDEPFFEDGMVAEEVREAVEAGVSFHSAAGNEGGTHYSQPFEATETDGGTYHAFAAGAAPDLFNRMDIPPGRTVTCVLQWNDPFGSSANDYDLELWSLDATPAPVQVSMNVQNGTQNPFEAVGAENPGSTPVRVGVRVRRESGADSQLKLVCIGASNLQYATPAGSIFGHPALTEVIAVGAMDVNDFGLNEVEAFSSQGPVDILFPAKEKRDKPNLVAFDRVATSVCPSAPPCFAPFVGTSAAAPHSAAVAALLLSKNSCLSPAEVRQALAAAADDILALGFDDVSGAGRLDAFDLVTAPGPCDDGNPCTRDTCTPATGCQNAPRADGDACPDGDLCNGDETCQAGVCTPGAPLVCNDGSPCTTDICSPSFGCAFPDACDDGDPCSTDTCDAVTGCLHAAAPDGTACPDADLCNGAETCQVGACSLGVPLVCDDGGACATSACDVKFGCQYPPIEGFGGLTCLCAQGLGSAGCVAPGGVVARYARACGLVTRASGAKTRRARRLLTQAARRINKAAKQTGRAANRGKLAPDCANALAGILEDALGRTLRLSSAL